MYYRANRDCLIFEELASISRKTSGLLDVPVDALGPLVEMIEVAFVFGSVAGGAEWDGRDVLARPKLFIVGSAYEPG